MANEPGSQSAGRQRTWVVLALVLVISALVVAYFAARPLIDWIADQLHSQDVDV